MSDFAIRPEGLLQAIVEHVGVAIAVIDEERRIVFANPAFRRLFGEDPDPQSMLIEDWWRFQVRDILGKEVTFAESAVMQVLGRKRNVDVKDVHVTFADGRSNWLHTSAHRFSVLGLSGVLAILTDESTEIEIRRLTEQVGRLEMMASLAKSLAHNFNNVLQTIQSNVYLALLDANLSESARGRLQHISGATKNASELVRRLTQFGRTETLQLQPVQLNEVVSSVLHLLAPRLQSVSVQTDLSTSLPMVDADRVEMEQVLVNLVVNALDAMPLDAVAQKQLHITTEISKPSLGADSAEEQTVLLSVSDSGTGISEEALPHIFEPFYTTKPSGEPRGLGLSSAYGIVRQHGGNILVKSRLGQGTEFTITLPQRKTISAAQSPPIQNVA